MSDLISRQDAIDAIEELPNAYNGWSDAYDKAYIIGALEEVPSATCDDCIWHVCNYNKIDWDGEDGYISRQDAIDAIMGEPTDAHYPSWYAQRIKLLPSAKPEIIACGEGELSVEPKAGEWVKRQTIGDVSFAYCSECGEPILHGRTSPLWNFCPNCGARMKGEEE